MKRAENLNIVTLGRSGAGKSSLLNYLIGAQRFKTGIGRPVTQKGFYAEKSIIADVPVTIIDSYGIESGENFKIWKVLLEEQLKKHDLSHSVREWFHVIIYCISAEDARIQPIDVEIIERFLKEGIKLIVVLTHADRCDEEDCKILKCTLQKKCDGLRDDDFVEICSVNEPEEFSGRGLRRMIIEQYLENILKALPEHCILCAKKEILKYQRRKNAEIKKRKYSILDREEDHGEWLSGACCRFVEKLNKKIWPQIIRTSCEEALGVSKSLGNILQRGARAYEIDGEFVSNFYTSLGKNNLWEDDDWFLKKVWKGTQRAITYIPTIIYSLFKGEDEVKQELSCAVANFANNLQKQVDDSKLHLKEFFEKNFWVK